MILLVGAKGNMGKRYAAILRSLYESFTPVDVGDPYPSGISKIIVATPTATHFPVLKELARRYPGAEILCEKPVVKSLEQLDEVEESLGGQLFCVNQYAHLPGYQGFKGGVGRTYYNYYKHGNDGLAWDCFQLFGLANEDVILSNTSPVWRCRINGTEVSLAGMDSAYVEMLKDFLGDMKRTWDMVKVRSITHKVLKWIAEEN